MSIGNNVGMNQNFLSDYASIKNGSYARLMKSYYGTGQTLGSVPSSSKKSTKTSNVLDKILEERKNPKVSKNVQEANLPFQHCRVTALIPAQRMARVRRTK